MQSVVKYEMKFFFIMQGCLFCVFFYMRMQLENETTTQTFFLNMKNKDGNQ